MYQGGDIMWAKTDIVPAFVGFTFLRVRVDNLSLKGFVCKQQFKQKRNLWLLIESIGSLTLKFKFRNEQDLKEARQQSSTDEVLLQGQFG